MNKLKPTAINCLQPPPPLPKPTTTKSYNALMNNLSAQNSHDQVLSTYMSMLKSNTPSDTFTFPNLLKACTSLGLFSHGLSVHQHIIVTGFPSDSYIATSLISFYAKFKCNDNARKVFDMMPERNAVSWTAIIGCYFRVGDINTGTYMFNQMRKKGIQPVSVTILSMLSGILDLTPVQCLHTCAYKYGFLSDVSMGNSLLNAYGKCGRIEDARNLFEWTNQRDNISWNSLVSGYTQIGDFKEALGLLKRMRYEGVEPDNQVYASVFTVLAAQAELELGKLVHGQIVTNELELDVHVETSLMMMYLRCRKVEDAFRIFEGISEKDVILWTAMITGLVQNYHPDEGLKVFHLMLELGVVPSTETIASALAACAQMSSLNQGTSIHGYVVRQNMALDVAAQNSLLTMYAKCGKLAQSLAIFNRMKERDLVSWNAIVGGYAQNGQLCRALLLFIAMMKNLQRPNSVTLVSLLQACASIGALQQGKWIHNFVIRSCLGQCMLVGTALVDMYSKCGDISTAQKCFDAMPKQDLVSWNTIIAGYGSHGRGDAALSSYSRFLSTGIEPNHVIFLSVLSACSHSGLIFEGLNIFQSMMKDFHVEPKLEHCACIVDLLSRAGRLEEAYNFFKMMVPDPSADVLGIILDACRNNGNVELGEIVARDIFSLKPVNAENYVQLARSYASMKRWDGVGEVWTKLRSLGLKKVPGWSFIELHGAITTFYNDHGSHSQYEDILLVLKSLRKQMKILQTDLNACKHEMLQDEELIHYNLTQDFVPQECGKDLVDVNEFCSETWM